MKVLAETRYGRLHLIGDLVPGEVTTGYFNADDSRGAVLTLPVDWLLVLTTDDEKEVGRATSLIFQDFFLTGIFGQYLEGGNSTAFEHRTWHKVRRQVRSWRPEGIPQMFFRAAKGVERGRFSSDLGHYLERVTFTPPGQPDEVPDYLALATWCLDQALRQGRYRLGTCRHCGHPFLSTVRARYCQRTAPHSGQTCQDVGKVLDYRARKRAGKEK